MAFITKLVSRVRALLNHLIPGRLTFPGNLPIKNGEYAGPVVDGKTEVASTYEPFDIKPLRFGSSSWVNKVFKISQRAPSRRRKITFFNFYTQ